jgi:hypothetical protein
MVQDTSVLHVIGCWNTLKGIKQQTPWSESASELHRPNDLRLSAKLVPNFADRGCYVVSVTDPYCLILDLLDRSRYLFFHVVPQLYSEAEWIPFQTHYFSENLVAPGIEPGFLDL